MIIKITTPRLAIIQGSMVSSVMWCFNHTFTFQHPLHNYARINKSKILQIKIGKVLLTVCWFVELTLA